MGGSNNQKGPFFRSGAMPQVASEVHDTDFYTNGWLIEDMISESVLESQIHTEPSSGIDHNQQS
jgi:hypothetical protein